MSITLTNAASVSINGAAQESDATGALTYAEFVYPHGLRLFYSYGNTAGQVFTPGALPKVIVNVDLTTGIWTSSNGLNGTLGSAALTALQNASVGLRNGLESFAVNNSILPGSTVAWVG